MQSGPRSVSDPAELRRDGCLVRVFFRFKFDAWDCHPVFLRQALDLSETAITVGNVALSQKITEAADMSAHDMHAVLFILIVDQ